MQNLINHVQKKNLKKIADIRPGYTVRVHQKIREGDKERIQIFEGLVIKLNSGAGTDKSFTVRKVVQGIGVEKIFPLHSKNVVQIEIKKKSRVKQAKLYYSRERFGKRARMKGDLVDIKAMGAAENEQVSTEERHDAQPVAVEDAPKEDNQTEAPVVEDAKSEEGAPKEDNKA